MSLNYEMARYTELTGEDGTKVPISRLGGYLDGYDKGVENTLNMLKEYGFEVINESIRNTMGDEIPLWMWLGMANKVEKRLKEQSNEQRGNEEDSQDNGGELSDI